MQKNDEDEHSDKFLSWLAARHSKDPRSDTFLIVARSFAWKQFGYRLRWLEWHSLQLGRKKEKRQWSMGPHEFHGLQAALCARIQSRIYAGLGTGPSWVVPFRWRVHNTHLSLLYPLVAPLLRTLLNIATREISFHYCLPSPSNCQAVRFEYRNVPLFPTTR